MNLRFLQKNFPKLRIEFLFDATEDLAVEVKEEDSSAAKGASDREGNHTTCALALACRRALPITAAIVTPSRVFLVSGSNAYRYELRETATREIVCNDRYGKGGFRPGIYVLKAPSPSNRLGSRPNRNRKRGAARGPYNKSVTLVHRTEGLRASVFPR